jgi:hypothetical protein
MLMPFFFPGRWWLGNTHRALTNEGASSLDGQNFCVRCSIPKELIVRGQSGERYKLYCIDKG